MLWVPSACIRVHPRTSAYIRGSNRSCGALRAGVLRRSAQFRRAAAWSWRAVASTRSRTRSRLPLQIFAICSSV